MFTHRKNHPSILILYPTYLPNWPLPSIQWQQGQERKPCYQARDHSLLLHSSPHNCELPDCLRRAGSLWFVHQASLPEPFHFLQTSPQARVSPCSPAFAMADTYAVVQKRKATSGPRSESGACSIEGTSLYSHVTPGARWPQAPTEEGAQLGGGELTGQGKGWGRPHPSPSGDPHCWTLCPRQIWLSSGGCSFAGHDQPEVSQAKPLGPHWVHFSGSHLIWAKV